LIYINGTLTREVYMSEQSVLMEAYCPGNGTRYELMLVSFEDKHGQGVTVFTWLNSPYGGRTMRLPRAGRTVTLNYITEKMSGCGSDADFAAIMVWLRKNSGVGVHIPRNYDMETGLPHRLKLVTG
jgi:hypothetical protein